MDETIDPHRLSRLIGDIYDAAVNPALWIVALERVARFVGGEAASLSSRGPTSGIVHHVYGIDSHYLETYFKTYISVDPYNEKYLVSDPLEPFATTDVLPFNQAENTVFYREWARPQGWVDFMGLVLDRSTLGVALLGVFRHERNGFADVGSRDRMRLVAPHIRRATLISRMFEGYTSENAAFADTLDTISGAVFAVDAAGRVIHANAGGYAMADQGPVRIAGGVIVAHDARENTTLREAIIQASNGDQVLEAGGISFGLSTDAGEHYIGHVLSLCSGRRRKAGARYGATATIFIRRAGLDMQSTGNVMGRAFKLTPTELRVLLGIVDVGGVPEVALALGIGEGTVKSHLHRVFHKTGTRRQADLVKLVGSFADPARN